MSLQPNPALASVPMSPARSWAKVIAGVLGTSVMLAVLVIAFALPASRSAPQGVPIGMVGAAAQINGVRSAATGFTVSTYDTTTDARTAIEHRDIYGALVLNSPGQVDILIATAASPTVAAMVQTLGQHLAQSTHRATHIDDVRGFPARDPKGIGLAAGALPLALGGWIGALVIMMLVPTPRRRAAGAIAFAVVGGLTVVATLQFVIGTFDGNFWLTSLAGMFGIAATCFTVLGLRELLGGAGLGVAAVLLVLLGNPLSGLASAPEMLPRPWGVIGQYLPPGATGTLMRDVAFFGGHGVAPALLTLTGYLLLGLVFYLWAVYRAQRTGTVDIDRVEFDRQPRPPLTPPYVRPDPSAAITQPLGTRHRRAPIAPAPQRPNHAAPHPNFGATAQPWRKPDRHGHPNTSTARIPH